MYLDDFLKYKRVCLACTYVDEDIVDKLLHNISNYIGKCTVINENDECDISLFRNGGNFNNGNFICFKPMENITKNDYIPYGDNFLVFKTYLHKSLASRSNYQIPMKLLHGCDLILYFYDGKVKLEKDRYTVFENKDLNKLYKEITISDRIYKLNKIKKRNEQITIIRKKDSLYLET